MKRFNLRLWALALGIILSVLVTIKGQASPKYEVEISEDAHCELNSRYIDMLIVEAKKNNERIFIISRISKNEIYKISQSRLKNAFDILTQTRGVAPEMLVTAIGERTSHKNGRLEFYVGSQLFLISQAERNKRVCLVCCAT